MALNEIKNTLKQNDTMPMLKLENEHYSFTVFYNGDYVEDRCNDKINPHVIKVKCKPKSSDIMISVSNLAAYIDMTNSFVFDIRTHADISELEIQLHTAFNTMTELQAVLDTYFT